MSNHDLISPRLGPWIGACVALLAVLILYSAYHFGLVHQRELNGMSPDVTKALQSIGAMEKCFESSNKAAKALLLIENTVSEQHYSDQRQDMEKSILSNSPPKAIGRNDKPKDGEGNTAPSSTDTGQDGAGEGGNNPGETNKYISLTGSSNALAKQITTCVTNAREMAE